MIVDRRRMATNIDLKNMSILVFLHDNLKIKMCILLTKTFIACLVNKISSFNILIKYLIVIFWLKFMIWLTIRIAHHYFILTLT